MPADFDRERRTRIEEFDKRQGGNAVQIDGWWFYANGARRELNAFGPLCEPPTEPQLRARYVLQYHEVRTTNVVNNFNRAKAELQMRVHEAIRHAAANTPPPMPSKDELAKLEELRQYVVACREALSAARVALVESRPAAIREREARAAAGAEQKAEFLAELNKIEI